MQMGKKLFVGNLDYEMADTDLAKLFQPYGPVEASEVIMDRRSGRSKGFGFVEMKTVQEAQAAIAALNGHEVIGRTLTVNEARPQPTTRTVPGQRSKKRRRGPGSSSPALPSSFEGSSLRDWDLD
jgi:RNA recognition motif-containing protein